MFNRESKIKAHRSVKKVSVVRRNQDGGYTWSNLADTEDFIKKYGPIEE